jgi:hypothetical protein
VSQNPKPVRAADREEKREPISIRTTPSVKARMAVAASKSGRSLTQEIEFRLEKSLEQDDLLKIYSSLAEQAERVHGVIGNGDTANMLMKIAQAIAEVEAAQGTGWCTPQADRSAYDMNLKDVMEGIYRVWFKRSEATISDFMALEHPLLMKDPPKMKD